MRISGGVARGIPLKTVEYPGFRPAMDAMRQALYSSLGSVSLIEGIEVLDLFAGSGAYGLEALSRGARKVTFVESDRRAVGVLQTNCAAVLKSLGHPDGVSVEIISRDVRQWDPREFRFDLILCDPPYEKALDLMGELWPSLKQWLKPGNSFGVVWEAPREFSHALPLNWSLIRQLGGKKQQASLFWLKPIK